MVEVIMKEVPVELAAEISKETVLRLQNEILMYQYGVAGLVALIVFFIVVALIVKPAKHKKPEESSLEY